MCWARPARTPSTPKPTVFDPRTGHGQTSGGRHLLGSLALWPPASTSARNGDQPYRSHPGQRQLRAARSSARPRRFSAKSRRNEVPISSSGTTNHRQQNQEQIITSQLNSSIETDQERKARCQPLDRGRPFWWSTTFVRRDASQAARGSIENTPSKAICLAWKTINRSLPRILAKPVPAHQAKK